MSEEVKQPANAAPSSPLDSAVSAGPGPIDANDSELKVVLFGSTGMIGQGVLRECLLDPHVSSVLAVGRGPSGQQHPKLKDLLMPDLADYSAVEKEFAGYNACFFCLGVASSGMKEAEYARVTYDFPMAAAQTMVRLNPLSSFVYISGEGADSSERGCIMWARIKGKAENAISKLPFKHVCSIRPGAVRPLHGIESRTTSYRIMYKMMTPLWPLLGWITPKSITNTERMGLAMLRIARHGAPKSVLFNADVNELAALVPPRPAV